MARQCHLDEKLKCKFKKPNATHIPGLAVGFIRFIGIYMRLTICRVCGGFNFGNIKRWLKTGANIFFLRHVSGREGPTLAGLTWRDTGRVENASFSR